MAIYCLLPHSMPSNDFKNKISFVDISGHSFVFTFMFSKQTGKYEDNISEFNIWTNFYLSKNKNVYNTCYITDINMNSLEILIYLLFIMAKRKTAPNFQQLPSNRLVLVLLVTVSMDFGMEHSILSF